MSSSRLAHRLGLVLALLLLVLGAVLLRGSPLSSAVTGSPGTRPGDGAIGADDGWVGRGSVPVDSDLPALTNLSPDLRRALDAAARDAAADGVTIEVSSGWRSRAYQQQLVDEAVAEHGRREASRWVAGVEASRHVTGDAVDVAPAAAARWLEQHGSAHGLCQVFANEPWHLELLTSPGGACPRLLASAAG